MNFANLTLANQLTLIRIFLVPFMILFMYIDNFWMRIAALLIFVIATITDIYDGRIARRTNTVTTLGTFLDPLADKLIISAALIAFVGLKEISVPAWMVTLIISREFVITGLRTIASSKNISIPASNLGKFKTASQSTAIIAIFIILIVRSALWHYGHMNADWLLTFGGWYKVWGWCLTKLPFWLVFVATLASVYSGIAYIKAHKATLREN
jgi:CDP-diacylglycerol--glycerol-3-phosphate 3-phosphatidyltransferase